jgi:hypothetical protein
MNKQRFDLLKQLSPKEGESIIILSLFLCIPPDILSAIAKLFSAPLLDQSFTVFKQKISSSAVMALMIMPLITMTQQVLFLHKAA